MNQHSADVKRIDEYINSLDKVEAKKRKAKYIFLVPIGVLVLAGSLTFYTISKQISKPLKEEKSERMESQVLKFEDLNFAEVQEHFQAQKGALVVEVSEMNKMVSLSSEKEYWQLLEELSLQFLAEKEADQMPVPVSFQEEEATLPEVPEVLEPTYQKVQKKSPSKRSFKPKRKKIEPTPVTRVANSVEEASSSDVSTPRSLDTEAEVFEAPTTPLASQKLAEASPKLSEAKKIRTESPSTISSEERATLSSSQSASQKPLVIASQRPAFPGGESKLSTYLNSRIKYPKPAKDYHVEGTVYIQFVVQPDGRLTHHKVLKGIGYGCDEEALRLTRSMPNWQAGAQNGENVPVLFTLPINFELLN